MQKEKEYPIHTYSQLEERLNIGSHLGGAILSGIALLLLILKAIQIQDTKTYVSFLVFGGTMLLLYLASTLYHSAKNPKRRYQLNILDHISIFVFIAGSYTPFALLTLKGTEGWIVFSVVWGIALVGTILKIFFTGKFDILSTILYVAMGWIIVFSFRTLLQNLDPRGIFWLAAGGVAYTIGAVFYSINRLKLNHAIFHIFVLLGSFCHFLSVYLYIYPINSI